MPILKDTTIRAGEARRGDVIKGQVAAAVKIGTKWIEIRDENSKMILRAPLGQTVKIKRPEPTEEEIAAAKAEREAQQRQWRDEAISSWLDNSDARYADALAKFTEAVKGGWAPQQYWDRYSDLAKAQAEHRIAKEVEHLIARSARESAFDPMDSCDAYDAWREEAREELIKSGFRGESRSTSVISNVMEDVWFAAVARHVEQDGRYFS